MGQTLINYRGDSKVKSENKYNPIAKAVRVALLAGITASMFSLPTVFAAEETDEEAETEEKKIVITGSRLARETYTSLSPLQIITAQASREVGLVDTSDILQGAAASSGQQIDLTFSGFVLDNGPGASTASLRGLGSARTLTLLNGRRLAPSGVEGAPAAADLNMVPAGLVQEYNLLLDGASSIYGSDAVAGVANILLRQDFDGLELDLFTSQPTQDNGESTTFSATWGANYDRGFIGFGMEYKETEATRLRDRRWTDECNKHVEVDENGQIRNVDLYYPSIGQRTDPRGCKGTSSLVGRISVPFAGSIYYTPGFSNGGWGDFSESSQFGLDGIDTDGDGISDVSFFDYSLNGAEESQNSHLYPQDERISFMTYGEYTFDGEANLTPFFEASYNKREYFVDAGAPQFFPSVPANNPYNLCNPNGIGGIDCGLAWDSLMNNPAVIAQVLGAFGCDPSTGGSCDQTRGAIGPASIQPIVSVRGDRGQTSTEVEQTRVVAGLRGDLPSFNVGSLEDWTFETYVSFTESTGTSSRMGIRQDRLDQALDVVETSPGSGQYTCVDTSNGCVPVNMMSPTLYNGLVGDFATQAERDFLFDSRDFETTYKQTIFSAFMGGDLATTDAGAITGGIGMDYRIDDINSIPDDIARDGLFFGFFSDGGAVGDKYTREFYAEVEIPVIANRPGVKEMIVNLSGRTTKDEFYGSNTTGSAKFGYRPVDYLLLRTTYGTSYRAPNVRENFLIDQSGFGTVNDPCNVPEAAWDTINGVYVPAGDEREDFVLANCVAAGVDPTTVGNATTTGNYSVEIVTGGILGLREETSTSKTYGFSWEQPFTNAFDLNIGATWYQIEISDTIVEPSSGYIVNDCYGNETNSSAFCSRITRDAGGVIDLIDSSFLNRDNQTVKGVDVNMNLAFDAAVFGNPVQWTADLTATHTTESSELFTNDDGTIDFDDDRGEFGYPEWKANLQLAARFGDFRATWGVTYIGSVEQDVDGIDEFDDISGISDTCLGAPDDVLCRDVGFADKYLMHSTSLYYYGDSLTVGLGVRNVFDKAPPVVDSSEVLAANNAPIGYGYDLQGRRIFLNVSKRF
jgi:iron complex outermembrane receptor protein